MTIRHGFVVMGLLAMTALCGAPGFALAKKAVSPIGPAGMSAAKSLADNIAAAKDFTMLAKAIKTAGIVDTLQGPGPFTVFAPSDEAFRKLPEGTFGNLMLDENKPQLVAILTYSLVPGAYTPKDLDEKVKAGGGKAELKTIQGEKLVVQIKGKAIEIVDAKGNTAHVTIANVTQSNGLVYVVDKVPLP